MPKGKGYKKNPPKLKGKIRRLKKKAVGKRKAVGRKRKPGSAGDPDTVGTATAIAKRMGNPTFKDFKREQVKGKEQLSGDELKKVKKKLKVQDAAFKKRQKKSIFKKKR